MSNKLTKIVYYANVITQCSVFGVLILVLFSWATNQPGQKELNNIFTTLFMLSLLTEVTLERAKKLVERIVTPKATFAKDAFKTKYIQQLRDLGYVYNENNGVLTKL